MLINAEQANAFAQIVAIANNVCVRIEMEIKDYRIKMLSKGRVFIIDNNKNFEIYESIDDFLKKYGNCV